MPNRFDRSISHIAFGTVLAVMAVVPVPAAVAEHGDQAAARLSWESAAHWRHGLTKTPGTLALTDSGIEFRAAKGPPLRWPFVEIQTFDLSPRRLTLTGYENRRWHFHGERRFRFDLESAVPPAVAAELAQRVAKPAENGVPDPHAPAFATLPTRHQTRGGGTNGVLQFRDSGIDYVTDPGHGARSWRWADIQTLALPDPYHLRVGGYRETFGFELKEPMSRELFDRLWNDVYARDLSGLNPKGGARP
jgi:hypothetical protein